MASRRPPPPPPSTTSRPPRPIRRGAAPTSTPTPPEAPSAGGISTKRLIWTGAFAAVTIVGAIYGAGLKTQQEYQAEKKQIAEATPDDRIRGLEERRSTLVAQRIPLERKLGDLRARMSAKEGEGEGQGAAAEGGRRP